VDRNQHHRNEHSLSGNNSERTVTDEGHDEFVEILANRISAHVLVPKVKYAVRDPTNSSEFSF
jgi:hypothetical protein